MPLKTVNAWKNLPAEERGAAVALGNFDGVHRGHQQVIAQAAKAALATHAPLGVVTFDPHPRRLFRPTEPTFKLMTHGQQARALGGLGVDLLYLLPFDFEMASFGDREFVEKVLVQGLGVKHVAVGFDISFGRGRSGSAELMKAYGDEYGFTVSVAEPVGVDGGEKFSSTSVRVALRDGRPERAAHILGRPFAIEGVVRRGQQLGRQLGFPTANVEVEDYVVPQLGVYATRTRLPDGREVPGVANLGNNPTTGEVETRLETWLFDFDEDLYGQVIETDLIAFLRPELKFDSLELMIEQIRRDEQTARAIVAPGF
ncbi:MULTISPECIES: bifunctional riboflavin kinase/FAD synthetase [Caulobacter]|jgi:riboflavin kinase/FMN adenylyltransferase|uniref:Riboflavin biosynthesis protein n=1 Tax=Caulobacter vibrioides OR37 TaxID=1292034 RepID=R0EPX1_CAUVI|nr:MULTISPECIES: bifunctional riboflavin kinase/FAD synthetase [Caulobacter]ENZ83092.1 riboflavin kinase, FMN adenylyltransferase [Caulobacter vibrioides OR37]MBQ1562243.1 bifunctional riboflavin kinase/FAD synthetase [Caulobacter sp.]